MAVHCSSMKLASWPSYLSKQSYCEFSKTGRFAVSDPSRNGV